MTEIEQAITDAESIRLKIQKEINEFHNKYPNLILEIDIESVTMRITENIKQVVKNDEKVKIVFI